MTALLRERITQDLHETICGGSAILKGVLRGVLTEIVTEEKRGKIEITLNDEQIITVLVKERKKFEESIMYAEQASRDDLKHTAQAALEVIMSYLPQEMTEDEVIARIQDIAQEVGVVSIKDMGKIMKVLSADIKGRFDGKRASELVKGFLA